MKKRALLLIPLLTILFAGCRSASAVVITEIPTQEATATLSLVVSKVPDRPDYCLECHTDKEQLTVLAKPVETVESESKGVG